MKNPNEFSGRKDDYTKAFNVEFEVSSSSVDPYFGLVYTVILTFGAVTSTLRRFVSNSGQIVKISFELKFPLNIKFLTSLIIDNNKFSTWMQ